MNPKRVLVVGFDGATFDIIRPLIDQGRLPNLANMLKEGVHGDLRSTIPPVTPGAWTSFFTGKNPGKHGIYDFQALDPETYSFSTVRTDLHAEKTLWNLLSDAGLRSIIWDVPFTYPPRPLNGWMLTGYGTPRTEGTVFTYPPTLEDDLPADLHPELKVALPWDLFMVVFSITDNMAHVFWTYVDPTHPNYHKPEAETYRAAFFDAYAQCDAILGDLRAAAGPQAVTLVISDHGFGSVRPRQYIFQRLMQGRYVQAAGSGRATLRSRLMKTAAEVYIRYPFLREWVKGLGGSGRRMVKQSLKRTGLMPDEKNISYSRSKIIPTNFGLRMWVNDTDRFGSGIVSGEKLEAVVEELASFLKADIDPFTGTPAIANVYRGADLYHGPYASEGPDIVIEYANSFDFHAAPTGDNPYTEGGHTLEGILVGHGPGLGKARLEGATLIDLAPTILHLLDQPVPPDMDGRVLADLFVPGFLEAHPVVFGDEPARFENPGDAGGYSAEEEAELEEQFRRLGYI
jgi:predicted AlkP superfamily phosphohydrolase/phosphomutase